MGLEQARVFTIFFALGIIIAFLFDVFRIIRKNIKTGYLITSIEDIIFVLFSGFLVFKSILVFSNGEIRFYLFLGIIFGIVSYILTIKNFCDIILTVIIKFILKLIKYLNIILKFFITRINIILNKIFKYIRSRKKPKYEKEN